MAKRIYLNKVKQWALDNKILTGSGVGGTLIGLLFLYLSFIGAITITGYSEDVICSGTLEDPCYAFINFTVHEDVFLYPIDYDPYGRNITIDFDPDVESWKIERSWGKGWREINMSTNCKGTWCGAPDNTGRTKYSIAFREGRDYRIRITVFKINPNDNIKWSAFGIDPVFFGLNNGSLKKEYNKSNREISFNSKIDDSNKFKIKLNTELVHNVIRGNDRQVAITNIENNYGSYPYELILGPIEFTDLKTNKTFKRDYHYEYKKSIGFKTVNDYGNQVCVTSVDLINGSETRNCVKFIVGTHQEEIFEWIDLDTSKNMLKGNLTVALVIDVLPNERVEWVPIIFGIEVNEWAEWSESLNVDSVSYYKLDGTSGTVIDSAGVNNGTNVGAIRGLEGIINNSFNFTVNISNRVDVPYDDSLNITTDTISISYWTKPVSSSARGRVIGIDWPTGTYQVILPVTPVKSSLVLGNETSEFSFSINYTIPPDIWTHVTHTFNGTEVRGYINGTLISTDSHTGNIRPNPTGNRGISIGAMFTNVWEGYNGQIDELGLWNRSLSASEVSDLYNNGTGITYINVFFPIITLNSPVDFFNTTNQIIDFNGTIIKKGGNGINNVTLFIDGNINETNSSGINDTDYLFTKIISDGNHNWTYEACGVNGECTTATIRNLTIDSISPTITVFRPLNITYNTTNIFFNATASETVDTWILNYNGTNITNFNINTSLIVESGSHQALFYANDSFGNLGLNDTIFFTVPTLSVNLSFEGIYSNITAELSSITINASTNLDTVCVDIDHPRFGINFTCEFVSNIFDFNPSFIIQRFTNTSNFSVFNFTTESVFNLSIDSHQYDEPDNLSINISGSNNPLDVIVFYLNTTADITNTTLFIPLIDRFFHGILNGPVVYLNKFDDDNTTKNLTYQIAGEKTVFFTIDDIIDTINTDFTFFLNISGFPFGIDFRDGNTTADSLGFNNYSLIDTTLTTAELDPSGGIMAKNTSETTYFYDDFEDGSVNTSLWTGTGTGCGGGETCTVGESGGKMILTVESLSGSASITVTSTSANDLLLNKFQADVINFSIDAPLDTINSESTKAYRFDIGNGNIWNHACARGDPGSSSESSADLNVSLVKINKTHWKMLLWGNDYCRSDGVETTRIYTGNETISAKPFNDIKFIILASSPDEQNEDAVMKIAYVNRTLATRENSSVISKSIYDASADIVSATPWFFAPTGMASASGESVATYLSADDGDNWESVTSGSSHIFTNTGRNLRWRFDFNITGADDPLTTIVLVRVNVSIPLGNPENISIDFGADGTTDFTFTGQLNSTNLQKQVNLSFVNISSAFISSNILSKTSAGRNYEHTYKIPLNISSQTIGTITVDAINLTYDPNPVVLNITNLTNVLGNSTSFTIFRIPIGIRNLSTENYMIVNINDLKYDYAGGNFSINITAHDSNYLINITREIFYYYSRWDFEFGLSSFPYLYFSPSTPTSQNVTPFGQTSSTPILWITNYGYGGVNSNNFIYQNSSLSCVDSYASINNTKPLASLWDNLTAYYPFDIDARDLSGNNDGTVTGATLVEEDEYEIILNFDTTGGQGSPVGTISTDKREGDYSYNTTTGRTQFNQIMTWQGTDFDASSYLNVSNTSDNTLGNTYLTIFVKIENCSLTSLPSGKCTLDSFEFGNQNTVNQSRWDVDVLSAVNLTSGQWGKITLNFNESTYNNIATINWSEVDYIETYVVNTTTTQTRVLLDDLRIHRATENLNAVQGGAYSFDGLNDTISSDSISDLENNNASFTFSAWVKYVGDNTKGQELTIMVQSTVRHWFILDSNKKPALWTRNVQNTAYQITTSPESLNINQWYFVVGQFDYANGKQRIYVDGVLKKEDSYEANKGVTDSFKIGSTDDYNPAGTFQRFFNGSIDEVRIYNRSLGAAEISTLYNRTKNRYYDSKLQSDWQTISWDNSYLVNTSIYLWSDYSCNSSTWTLFEPEYFFRQCANGVDFCSEDID